MLMVKIPSAGTTAIPVVLLMRALGMENDRDIFSAIAGPVEAMKYTVANLNDVKDNPEYGVDNTEEAMAWLEKKFAAGQQKEYRESRIQNLLDKELRPHLGSDESVRTKKAIFLGRIVRQVLEMAITNRDPNDKDHYANKRVRTRWRPNGGPFQSWCSGPCKRLEVPTRETSQQKRENSKLTLA